MSFDDSTSTNLMRELAALAPKYPVSWCPLCGGGYGRGRIHTCPRNLVASADTTGRSARKIADLTTATAPLCCGASLLPLPAPCPSKGAGS